MRVFVKYLSIFLVCALATATAARATNGMYLTAYGAETAGRGGANLAISDRTLAVNFNPAGIAQLRGNHLTASLATLMPGMASSNGVNGLTDANGQVFPLPAVAYVRGSETPWTWGVGLVAQGGMGARYEAFDSFFGSRDEIFSEVRFATIVPTVAYAINEDMSFGLSLNMGYSDVAFRFFPETSFFNQSDPQNSFFGVRMEPAGGFQFNARAGWWWRPRPRFAIGLIYQTETESDFSGGNTEIDFTNHPFLGQKVGYSADVDGFTFAAQAGIGIAFRPRRDWMVAIDLKRYFWDDAVDTVLVTAREPDVAGAPAEVVLPFVLRLAGSVGGGHWSRLPAERTADAAWWLQLRREPRTRRHLDAVVPGHRRAPRDDRGELARRQPRLGARRRACFREGPDERQRGPAGQSLRSRLVGPPRSMDRDLQHLLGVGSGRCIANQRHGRCPMTRAQQGRCHVVARAAAACLLIAVWSARPMVASPAVARGGERGVHAVPRQARKQAAHRQGQVLRRAAHLHRLRGDHLRVSEVHCLPRAQAGLDEVDPDRSKVRQHARRHARAVRPRPPRTGAGAGRRPGRRRKRLGGRREPRRRCHAGIGRGEKRIGLTVMDGTILRHRSVVPEVAR